MFGKFFGCSIPVVLVCTCFKKTQLNFDEFLSFRVKCTSLIWLFFNSQMSFNPLFLCFFSIKTFPFTSFNQFPTLFYVITPKFIAHLITVITWIVTCEDVSVYHSDNADTSISYFKSIYPFNLQRQYLVKYLDKLFLLFSCMAKLLVTEHSFKSK